ncbi:MAG: alpha/beta fold hydrolase [Bryobacterales bacterium]|nr:alpha/beta fold hydrolase [Bryobacterales bacterium]
MILPIALALLTASLGDFRLENGQVIRDCRITYRTFGELNADRSNVILVPTWFNGVSEDWKQYIGRNGLLDDSRFYIIVVDALGNGNSSSPSNHVRRGSAFPQFTIRDMVETQYRLLTSHLAIPRVFATAGVSMGGMQVFEWMTAYPDFQERAIPIVATPQMSRRDIALWSAFFNLGNLRRDAQAEEEPKRDGGFRPLAGADFGRAGTSTEIPGTVQRAPAVRGDRAS